MGKSLVGFLGMVVVGREGSDEVGLLALARKKEGGRSCPSQLHRCRPATIPKVSFGRSGEGGLGLVPVVVSSERRRRPLNM